MPTHRLRIFPKGIGWKVRPGKVHVRKGHSVTWKSATRAIFWFPEKKLFGRNHLVIPAGGKRTLKVRTDMPGRYPYCVYCLAHKCYAHGSEPEMIVP